jgi:hypothetical protein
MEKFMELKIVKIDNPNSMNMILGQSHFIKTVEDVYEAMVSTVPMAKFGLAFCEASDVCLVRHTGTDAEMLELAQKNALALKRNQKCAGGLTDLLCHRESGRSHHRRNAAGTRHSRSYRRLFRQGD